MQTFISSNLFIFSYFTIALLISTYFSIKAYFIFMDISKEPKRQTNNAFNIHNFYFHFICYAIGWILTFILINEFATINSISDLNSNYLLLSILSLLSITGYLPPFIDGISKTPRSIADKLSK